MPTDPVFKRCPCGAALTRSDWLALPVCGDQRFPGGPAIELRNHSCGSTIAVEVPSLLEQLGRDLADLTVAYGAPLVSKAIDALPTSLTRDEILCACAAELGRRGRNGLRNQILAFRFVEPSRRAS